MYQQRLDLWLALIFAPFDLWITASERSGPKLICHTQHGNVRASPPVIVTPWDKLRYHAKYLFLRLLILGPSFSFSLTYSLQ